MRGGDGDRQTGDGVGDTCGDTKRKTRRQDADCDYILKLKRQKAAAMASDGKINANIIDNVI